MVFFSAVCVSLVTETISVVWIFACVSDLKKTVSIII